MQQASEYIQYADIQTHRRVDVVGFTAVNHASGVIQDKTTEQHGQSGLEDPTIKESQGLGSKIIFLSCY